MNDEPGATIGRWPSDRVDGLIVDTLRTQAIELGSCLDVGCGRNPIKAWFDKIATGSAPHYLGVDSDRSILDDLAAMGVDAIHPSDMAADASSDLVIAKEVLEHLPTDETTGFLEFCASHTGKLFVLTTPNFEYWPNLKAEDRRLRWVPDHFRDYKPKSADPHHHKQAVTPARLDADLRRAFPEPVWDVRVFRAWPWQIRDQARDREWTLWFKIFAVAVRV